MEYSNGIRMSTNKTKKISCLHLIKPRARSLNELFEVAQFINKWIEKNDLPFFWLPVVKGKLINYLKSETNMKTKRICNILEQLSILKKTVPVSIKYIKRMKKRNKKLLNRNRKSKLSIKVVLHAKSSGCKVQCSHSSRHDDNFLFRNVNSIDDIYEINEQSFEVLKNLPLSFSAAFDYLIKQCSVTEEELSEKTNISVRTISELRNKEKEHVKLETVIKLCIGLNLDICICEAMIRKSGNILRETRQQLMYKRILYYAPIITIEECNKLLSRAGFKEL